MKFAAIADWADSDEYPVAFMCEQLGVSRSGYYAWRDAPPSVRATFDELLTALIVSISQKARGNPGVRRVRAGLAAAGHRVSHKRVHRLMQAAGLRGRHPKAWRRTTIPGEKPVPAPDLIGRAFTAGAGHQVVRRRDVHQDLGGLGLCGHRHRPALEEAGRLGGR